MCEIISLLIIEGNNEAVASGSLDPSICARLEEAEPLLMDRADPKVLGQVLVDLNLLPKEDVNKTLVSIIFL